MKFGVREICDVVLRAKAPVTIGTTSFAADEPVLYFDSCKTSTVEGTSTTVYATGGRGNSRLIAWEGERQITFNFEDALLSPLGFAVLSGANIVEAAADAKINVHTTLQTVVTVGAAGAIDVDVSSALSGTTTLAKVAAYGFILDATGEISKRLTKVTPDDAAVTAKKISFTSTETPATEVVVLVDFYVAMDSGVTEMSVTANKFAGYYYLEAATLFRRESDGVDMPAQFIIPKAKIKSDFKFQMAATGDPSTFAFDLDVFPDYNKFNKTKKMLFALQIVG